jgi:hypothetical protein
MPILKSYNQSTSQWEPVVVGKQGPQGIQGIQGETGYGAVNAIINGAFDVWQRGASFGLNTYTADRWALVGAGGGTEGLTRQNFTPGSAPVPGYEGQHFARYNRTTTGGDSYFLQRVEDARTFAGQTVTLSYWAKASANTTISQVYASAYMGVGGSGGPAGNGNFSGRAITTSWARYTETFTVPAMPSSAVFGSGHYLEVVFKLGSEMGNILIDFWGVQLEAGSAATPFRRNANSIQGELAACHRYFERIDSFIGTVSVSGSAVSMNVPYSTRKRAAPSFSLSMTNANYGTNWTFVQASQTGCSKSGTISIITPAGSTVHQAHIAFFGATYSPTPNSFEQSTGFFIEINSEL